MLSGAELIHLVHLLNVAVAALALDLAHLHVLAVVEVHVVRQVVNLDPLRSVARILPFASRR